MAFIPPIDPAIITVRSQSKHSKAIRHRASPSTPSTESAGTRQSVRKISEVGEDRQPSLSNSRPTPKPDVSVGTTNAVTDNASTVTPPAGWEIGDQLGSSWNADLPLAATNYGVAVSTTP